MSKSKGYVLSSRKPKVNETWVVFEKLEVLKELMRTLMVNSVIFKYYEVYGSEAASLIPESHELQKKHGLGNVYDSNEKVYKIRVRLSVEIK